MTRIQSGTALIDPPAVVVGLCAHGLAVARALTAGHVRVTALEANRKVPGVRTRAARVVFTEDINGSGLIDGLLDLRRELPDAPDPVLFLTNDNMVRVVAREWERLEGRYRLSWAHCRQDVLRLLDKTSLEAHCREHGLPYPKTWLLENAEALGGLTKAGLAFPLIVKPALPLSGFKVRLIDDGQGLRRLVDERPQSLPFLLQHWVPGDDRRILFTAFYLHRGQIRASFCGRKLASKPAALGQTTVAESFEHEGIRELAERFFAPLGLSGPVSLEAKLDAKGQPWIIEPTLGRTDYWLDCCVANGVNLPLIEYQDQSGMEIAPARQTQGMIWFDTERSPLSHLRLRLGRGETASGKWRARFAYWDRSDPMPALHSAWRVLGQTGGRVWNRVARAWRSGPGRDR